MKRFFVTLGKFIAPYLIGLGATSFLAWLVCLCFEWEFKFMTITGFWFVFCLLSSFFNYTSGKPKRR